MHSTDPTFDTLVSGVVDPAGTPSAERPSGRRRVHAEVPTAAVDTAAAASFAVLPSAPPQLDTQLSPRRAARAAREAAAAVVASVAPASPVVAEVQPARGRRAAQAPLDEKSVAPAVAEPSRRRRATPVEAPTLPSPVVETVVTAVLPIVSNGVSGQALASSVPLHAPSSTGRRQSYIAATPEAATHRPAAAKAPEPRRRLGSATRAVRSAGVATSRPAKNSLGTSARRFAVTTVIAGILATSVLPVLNHVDGSAAYAASTGIKTTPNPTGGQQFDVASTVADTVAARDGYSATPVTSYENSVIAARLADTNMVYTGPTAAEYLAHPLYSHDPLDRAQVFQVALQYLGTPYLHGGETPAAFDCSGFISFVYAQFGINLPHYVPSQDAIGETIPESEAVPGDLVIFNTDDHDGFYAGNGMIMDAPKPGGHITVRPIWDAPHHFVRINP
ncbi:MAG: hypothetical protein JWP75_2294 [Frondihabitans sp.]|nr:hypothetical protein [Frondihabitans sp.]